MILWWCYTSKAIDTYGWATVLWDLVTNLYLCVLSPHESGNTSLDVDFRCLCMRILKVHLPLKIASGLLDCIHLKNVLIYIVCSSLSLQGHCWKRHISRNENVVSKYRNSSGLYHSRLHKAGREEWEEADQISYAKTGDVGFFIAVGDKEKSLSILLSVWEVRRYNFFCGWLGSDTYTLMSS